MTGEDALPTSCTPGETLNVLATSFSQESTKVLIDKVMTEKDRHKVLASSPTGNILVCGVPVNSILDTGAETSLMTSAFYHQRLANRAGELGQVGKFVRLVGANNLDIPVEGYIEAPVSIQGQTFNAVFLVTKDDAPSSPGGRREKFPVLLGCNILRVLARKLRGAERAHISPDWDLALRWFKSHERPLRALRNKRPNI